MGESLAFNIPMSIHGLALEVRNGDLMDLYDLSGYTQSQVVALCNDAFGTPIPASDAMRASFTIGGGKNSRQKYSEELPKYFKGALRDIGFEEDRGASCCLQCQGSFKYQHDTDKNVKTMHVFPHVTLPEVAAAGEDDGLFWAPDTMSPEYMATVCSLKTFKLMTQAKVPTFGQKKILCQQMKEMGTRIQGFEERLCNMDSLSDAEQELYDAADLEAMAEKIKWIEEGMETMVNSGLLWAHELKDLKATNKSTLQKMQTNLEAAQAAGEEKKAKKIEQRLKLQAQRETQLAGCATNGPTWSNEELARRASIEQLWSKVLDLEKIENSKQLLDAASLAKLSKKGNLETELENTMAACRTWYDDEMFEKIMGEIKARAIGAGKKKKDDGGGWKTQPIRNNR